MDCPNCHTWNPDDKLVCLRCQTELPRPVEKKQKQGPTLFLGLPVWTWVVVVLMLIAFYFIQSQAFRLVAR